MHTRPDLAWYITNADTSAPTRLLDDEGRPEPGLSTDAERALADLAAAVHATAWRLGERELRQLEARHSDDDELHEFASVADKFMRLMDLSGRPDVEENLDFLYNGTLGCIGILKDWLERAMAVALVRHEELDKVKLTLTDLRRTRMPANAILSVRSQIVRMERSMTFSETDVEHDQIVHGEAPVRGLSEALNGDRRSSAAAAKRTRIASSSVATGTTGTTTIVEEKAPKRRLKPGQRKPVRDPVSNSEMWGA